MIRFFKQKYEFLSVFLSNPRVLRDFFIKNHIFNTKNSEGGRVFGIRSQQNTIKHFQNN